MPVRRRVRSRDDTSPDRAALMEERERLLQRLREIDRLADNRRETAVIQPPETR